MVKVKQINLTLLKNRSVFSDLAKTLGEAIEKDVVYEQQPYDEWSKKLQGVGIPEWMASICSQKGSCTVSVVELKKINILCDTSVELIETTRSLKNVDLHTGGKLRATFSHGR